MIKCENSAGTSEFKMDKVKKEFYLNRTIIKNSSHLGLDISAEPNFFSGEDLSLVHVFNGGKSLIFVKGKEIYCFGENNKRSLGINSEKGVYKPVRLACLEFSGGIEALASGEGHVVALDKFGKVYTWGDNEWGQLGNGTKEGPKEKPCPLKLPSVKQIACGYRYTLAVDENNKVWYWGCLDGGVMKSNYKFPEQTTPVCIISNLSETVSISCGAFHAAIKTNNGLVMSWGWNGYGQLGHGHTKTVLAPKIIAELELNVLHIACGRNSTLILDAEGCISIFGQTNTSNVTAPTLVRTKKAVIAVAMCWRYDIFAIIDEEKYVYYWGHKVRLSTPTRAHCCSIVDVFINKDTPIVYPTEATLIVCKKALLDKDEPMEDIEVEEQNTEEIIESNGVINCAGDSKKFNQNHHVNSSSDLNFDRLRNRKKRKYEDTEEETVETLHSINDILLRISNHLKESDDDEDKLFGRYVACHLKKLNPSLKAEIKFQIEKLFYNLAVNNSNSSKCTANEISRTYNVNDQ